MRRADQLLAAAAERAARLITMGMNAFTPHLPG
jgi:hypothetical protein